MHNSRITALPAGGPQGSALLYEEAPLLHLRPLLLSNLAAATALQGGAGGAQEACALYEQIPGVEPDGPAVWALPSTVLGYAHALEHAGRAQDAEAALQRALSSCSERQDLQVPPPPPWFSFPPALYFSGEGEGDIVLQT